VAEEGGGSCIPEWRGIRTPVACLPSVPPPSVRDDSAAPPPLAQCWSTARALGLGGVGALLLTGP